MIRLGDLAPGLGALLPCWRKIRHTEREPAEAQLRSLIDRGLQAHGLTPEWARDKFLHVYQCPHCGGWHVGRTSLGRFRPW